MDFRLRCGKGGPEAITRYAGTRGHGDTESHGGGEEERNRAYARALLFCPLSALPRGPAPRPASRVPPALLPRPVRMGKPKRAGTPALPGGELASDPEEMCAGR